ncbi:MAG: CopD family protein [Acetobacteraceae bacterium]
MLTISLLKAVHVLSAVLWVGGMFFAYVVLRPSLGVLDPPQRLLLHTQVFRRFFLVVWHAMPLILVTGFLMIWLYGGMANLRWPVHTMLLLGLIMSAVFLAIFFGPYRGFRRTTDHARMASTLDTIRKLIGVNLVLGLVTIFIAFFN